MKTISNPARLLTLSGMLLFAPLVTPAAPADGHSEVIKELNILSNIFSAALEQEDGGNFPAFPRAPEALYLAGQGMVFTFNIHSPLFGNGNLDHYWQQFGQQFGRDIAQGVREVVTQVGTAFPEMDLDFDFDQPAPSAGNGQDAARDALAEQGEQLREMARELRDAQRDMQNLQRELRTLQRGPAGDPQALETRIAGMEEELEAQRQTLDAQRQAYEARRAEYEARQQEQRSRHHRALALQVVSTLCDYGITLRSLPQDEHVSLILENFQGDSDQVYVFDYSDIADCSSGEELLDKAVSYSL